MHGTDDPSGTPSPSRQSDDAPFGFMKRRRRSRRRPATFMALVVALLLLVGGLAWYLLRSPDPVDSPVADPHPTMPDTAVADRSDAPDIPALDLPELGASDAFIRELVTRLSAHPQLAQWLVTDSLIERFVAVVVSLAAGSSPVEHVEFLVPDDDFLVQVSGNRTVIDPATYRRYDLIAETFTSLDTEGTAQLYHQLHPLFVEAHGELGIPDQSFDEAMAMAVQNLLAVDVPISPPEVEQVEVVYEFTDPGFEGRSPAEKHILRMGPNNAQKIQEKLQELSDAIDLPLTSDGPG